MNREPTNLNPSHPTSERLYVIYSYTHYTKLPAQGFFIRNWTHPQCKLPWYFRKVKYIFRYPPIPLPLGLPQPEPKVRVFLRARTTALFRLAGHGPPGTSLRICSGV